MEFSIQKVKRCGKSVLCPHRREAARVVFFTVFLPFLLLLLWGIFLYHSPRFFSVKLMGQTVFVSVFAVGTAAAAIFFLFFYLPLWLGAKYWYLEICRPGKLRVPSVFYYFSSFRLYGKAVFTGFQLVFCRAVLILLGLLPSGIAAVVSAVIYRQSTNDLGRSLSLLCLIASTGLLLCGMAGAKYAGRRYFWVPWLLAADPSMTSRRLFEGSVRLCHEKRAVWEGVYRRLWGKRLLSFGILPSFWALPIVNCTLALWLSGQLPIYEKNNFPAPFRQRKIRHLPARKKFFPA